jgi:integrase
MSRRAANRPEQGDMRLSHQIRIWDIRTREGKQDLQNPRKRPKKSYIVRWTVAGKEHQRTFATRALADAERAKLIGYQQRGAAFDVSSGQPEPLLRDMATRTWYQHMCAYVDMKWSMLAPKSRRAMADALATVTPALVNVDETIPAGLRELVYAWAANSSARKAGPAAQHLAPVLRWLERNTIRLPELVDRTRGPEITRRALDLIALKLDGDPAAPNTVARKKAVFYNALEYAVELGLLPVNPIDHVSWRTPKTMETVERTAVVNMTQGRRLLAAVGEQGEMGQRLVAFFAAMLYSGLRPAESINLRKSHLVSMPPSGWGELLLTRSLPRSGIAWTDSGASREERGLKHRADRETRHVPAHPELVAIINSHIERFGFGPGEYLTTGPRGGLIDENTYLPIWRKARAAVLTPAELASPLVRRPYDLRHTAVSTWLNAGVPPTQIAEWAGHSVAVLLKVYAKCIVGQDRAARARIEEALRDTENDGDQA